MDQHDLKRRPKKKRAPAKKRSTPKPARPKRNLHTLGSLRLVVTKGMESADGRGAMYLGALENDSGGKLPVNSVFARNEAEARRKLFAIARKLLNAAGGSRV